MFRFKLLSIAALMSLATACGGPITAVSTEDHTFENVGSSPRVVVTSHNGDIKVRTGADGEVYARVEKEGRGWSEDDAEDNMRDIVVAYETEGNTVRVNVRSLGRSSDWDDDNGADIELTIPKGAALDLTTDNGDIAATSTTAPVMARTTNGAIDIQGGQGAIDLRTTNGSISASPSGEAFTNFSTTNGRIDFTGTLKSGINAFETTNGNITIRLPTSAEFEFDAETTNGDVWCGYSYTTMGTSRNESLRGTVGSDSSVKVRARATNGNIRIEKR